MDYVRINRDYWTRLAPGYAESASENWSSEPSWGPWRIPESELAVLGDVAGKDALELGCGTGYFSAWLARMGARPTGIDVTPAQLETARRMQAEYGITFPLIEANAEEVPLPDASFDLILSEYGASIWCDPYRWIPEASRLLRPGGELVFLVNGTLLVLTAADEDGVPAGVELLRDYFDMHRFEWPDEDDKSVEFHLGYGDWIRLLRANNLEVLDLVELRAPKNAAPSRYELATPEWARRWPAEEIWKARKRR